MPARRSATAAARPPNPAPMIATLGERRCRAPRASARRRSACALQARHGAACARISNPSSPLVPPCRQDVGVLRGPCRRRSCPAGSWRPPCPLGCSSPGCRTFARLGARLRTRATTVRPTRLRRRATPRPRRRRSFSAHAITQATWLACTSSRYGKFTVKPDWAMLTHEAVRKTAARAGRGRCARRRAHFSVSVTPSRPIDLEARAAGVVGAHLETRREDQTIELVARLRRRRRRSR